MPLHIYTVDDVSSNETTLSNKVELVDSLLDSYHLLVRGFLYDVIQVFLLFGQDVPDSFHDTLHI